MKYHSTDAASNQQLTQHLPPLLLTSPLTSSPRTRSLPAPLSPLPLPPSHSTDHQHSMGTLYDQERAHLLNQIAIVCSSCSSSSFLPPCTLNHPFSPSLLLFNLHPSPFTLHPSPFTLLPSPFSLPPSPLSLISNL